MKSKIVTGIAALLGISPAGLLPSSDNLTEATIRTESSQPTPAGAEHESISNIETKTVILAHGTRGCSDNIEVFQLRDQVDKFEG